MQMSHGLRPHPMEAGACVRPGVRFLSFAEGSYH